MEDHNNTKKRLLSILQDTLQVAGDDAHRLAPLLAANQNFLLLIEAQDRGTREDGIWRELCFQAFDFLKHCPAGKRGNLGEGSYFFGPELSADVIEVEDGVLVDLIPRAFDKNAAALPEQLKVLDRVALTATLAGVVPSDQLLSENVWWLPLMDEAPARLPVDTLRFGSWAECFRQHLHATLQTEKMIEEFKQASGRLLSQEEVQTLCARVKRILRDEPNVIPINGPALVIGDIHGQFNDLLEILKTNEGPEDRHLVFLGDFVDRGYHSIPVISLVLLLKTKYPERVHLLRGNHECDQVAKIYGFYDELGVKYGDKREEIFAEYVSVFNMMPLAALIGGRVLGIHAGLSPAIHAVRQIQVLNRFRNIPVEGPITDLVWSDPDDEKDGWTASPRGAGLLFGISPTRQFVENNGLSFIVRSHQLVMPGFLWQHDNRMLTIFSAPNYCYRCSNLGGILLLDESCQPTPKSYSACERQKEEASITSPNNEGGKDATN